MKPVNWTEKNYMKSITINRIMKISFCFFLFFFSFVIFAQENTKKNFEFNNIDYGFAASVVLNGPEVSYIDTGKGNNIIVLVHGLGSNAGFWKNNIPELAATNRVIAIDLPGYGKSSKGDYQYDMSFYTEILKKFVDKLKIKKFCLVGHSMGGQISIQFFLKYPEYVKKLILISPAGIESFNEEQSMALKKFITPASVKLSDNETIKNNIKNNFYVWNEKYSWLVEERIKVTAATDFDNYAEAVSKSVAGMLDEPTSNLLDKIMVPTMIIFGTEDRLIPNKFFHPQITTEGLFKSAADKINNCRLSPIKNAGHLAMIENPNEVNKAILNFVKN